MVYLQDDETIRRIHYPYFTLLSFARVARGLTPLSPSRLGVGPNSHPEGRALGLAYDFVANRYDSAGPNKDDPNVAALYSKSLALIEALESNTAACLADPVEFLHRPELTALSSLWNSHASYIHALFAYKKAYNLRNQRITQFMLSVLYTAWPNFKENSAASFKARYIESLSRVEETYSVYHQPGDLTKIRADHHYFPVFTQHELERPGDAAAAAASDTCLDLIHAPPHTPPRKPCTRHLYPYIAQIFGPPYNYNFKTHRAIQRAIGEELPHPFTEAFDHCGEHVLLKLVLNSPDPSRPTEFFAVVKDWLWMAVLSMHNYLKYPHAHVLAARAFIEELSAAHLTKLIADGACTFNHIHAYASKILETAARHHAIDDALYLQYQATLELSADIQPSQHSRVASAAAAIIQLVDQLGDDLRRTEFDAWLETAREIPMKDSVTGMKSKSFSLYRLFRLSIPRNPLSTDLHYAYVMGVTPEHSVYHTYCAVRAVANLIYWENTQNYHVDGCLSQVTLAVVLYCS